MFKGVAYVINQVKIAISLDMLFQRKQGRGSEDGGPYYIHMKMYSGLLKKEQMKWGNVFNFLNPVKGVIILQELILINFVDGCH